MTPELKEETETETVKIRKRRLDYTMDELRALALKHAKAENGFAANSEVTAFTGSVETPTELTIPVWVAVVERTKEPEVKQPDTPASV